MKPSKHRPKFVCEIVKCYDLVDVSHILCDAHRYFALTSHSFQFERFAFIFSVIQFNCLFLVAVTVCLLFLLLLLLFCHFLACCSGRGEIYGKSERFMGFRAMGLLYNFCFHFVFSSSFLFMCSTAFSYNALSLSLSLSGYCACVRVSVCSSLCLLSLEICCFFIIILIKCPITSPCFFHFFP